MALMVVVSHDQRGLPMCTLDVSRSRESHVLSPSTTVDFPAPSPPTMAMMPPPLASRWFTERLRTWRLTTDDMRRQTRRPMSDASGRRGAIRVDAAIVTEGKLRYTIAIFVRRGGDTRYGVDNAGVLLGAKLSRLVYDRWARKD